MTPRHISCAEDLVTTHEDVRKGFLEQAVRKTQEATPYVREAIALRNTLATIADIDELAQSEHVLDNLLTAAGFSDKAQNHLTNVELHQSLADVLQRMSAEDSSDWRDEIVYRFLLTRGDSLGGTMRNITGAEAGVKFASAVINAVEDNGHTPSIRRSPKGKIQQVRWSNRVLLFDRKTPFMGNNIDAILLEFHSSVSKMPSSKNVYLACGELKGGIDPAGADEHWKTARSALDRIRVTFSESLPLFFAGAAIELSMARELYQHLQAGTMTHAANLNVPEQLADLAAWLVSL